MRDSLRPLVWRGVVTLWVMAPLLGVWPGSSPKSGQLGWWVLASVLVVACGIGRAVRRTVPVFGWGVGAVLLVLASHLHGIGFALGWAYQSTLILIAAWLIAERGEWAWIRQAVIGVAWLQVGLVILERFGVSLFPTAGAWPHGSLTTRTGVGILWLFASLWSPRRPAVIFTLLACLTGSWTAAFAVLALAWRYGQVTLPLLITVPVLLVVNSHLWWDKLAGRFDTWKRVYWLHDGWLTGWGFLPFPVGFITTDPTGAVGTGTQVSIYLNNTWLDWVGRTGAIGALLMAGLLWVASRQLTTSWRVWTFFGLLWVGCWQSAEVLPVFSLLGVCSVLGWSHPSEARC